MVTRGEKFILRSELMYRRAGAGVDPVFHRAQMLLMRAQHFEASKDFDAAIALYKQAFKLCPELEAMS